MMNRLSSTMTKKLHFSGRKSVVVLFSVVVVVVVVVVDEINVIVVVVVVIVGVFVIILIVGVIFVVVIDWKLLFCHYATCSSFDTFSLFSTHYFIIVSHPHPQDIHYNG